MVNKSKIATEVREVLGISLFFYIAFLIFQIYKKVTLIEYNIEYAAFGMALIGALVIGKVVFLIDKLPLTRKMDEGPRIYAVLYRSLIYLLGFILFSILEHLVKELVSAGTLKESLVHSLNYIYSLEYAGTLIFTFIIFLFFNTYWAIRNHIGRREIFILFFRREQNKSHQGNKN